MKLSAFNADASLREQLITCLQIRASAKHLVPGPLMWDGTKGSVVGCLLEGEDLAVWANVLGLPQWLALVMDSLCANEPALGNAVGLAVKILRTIQPGSDQQAAGSVLLLRLLNNLEHASRRPALSEALRKVLADVRSLHDRNARGAFPDPAEWRSARKAATAITDTLTEPWERACATCVETACWPPQRSRSVVYDTLRVWGGALMAKAIREFGWDQSSDAAMGKLFASLHERFLKNQPDAKQTMHELLAEHHPAESLRLRRLSEVQKETAALTALAASAMLLEALQTG